MSFLPSGDRKYLEDKGIPHDEVEENGQRGLILQNLSLPSKRYDAPKADVLVLLPTNYNDAGPDMFYTEPWVKLVPENCYAKAADQSHNFCGRSWQRWSRHSESQHWRPGIDGIRTVIQRVRAALENATP